MQMALANLYGTVLRLQKLIRQHQEMQEILGLPLLRKNFTARETKAVEQLRLADMRPLDIACLLRPMASIS